MPRSCTVLLMLVASAAVQAGECVVLLHGLARTANSMSTMQEALIEDGYELGIIAGTRSIDPIASAILSDPDDGRVSLEDTKLDGMDDFAVVAHSHAFMMRMQTPIELTIRFLRTGSFSPEKI